MCRLTPRLNKANHFLMGSLFCWSAFVLSSREIKHSGVKREINNYAWLLFHSYTFRMPVVSDFQRKDGRPALLSCGQNKEF